MRREKPRVDHLPPIGARHVGSDRREHVNPVAGTGQDFVKHANGVERTDGAGCFFCQFTLRRRLRAFAPAQAATRKIPQIRPIAVPDQQDPAFEIGGDDCNAITRHPAEPPPVVAYPMGCPQERAVERRGDQVKHVTC